MRWRIHISLVIPFFMILINYQIFSFIKSRVFPVILDRKNKITKLEETLQLVSSQLELLRQRHRELVAQIKKTGDCEPQEIKNLLVDDVGPSKEYELLKRRIHSNTKEFWAYISHALKNGPKGTIEYDEAQEVLEALAERKRSLLSDQEILPSLDGYKKWRRREATVVENLVHEKLHHLQNPSDCRNARKLLCKLKDCDFGCQHHHLAYCLTFALATNRTLVLDNFDSWNYDKQQEWTNIFYPLSETCTDFHENIVTDLSDVTAKDTRVLILSSKFAKMRLDELLNSPNLKDLTQRIVRFKSDPMSWWVGQMLRYIMKPRPHFLAAINNTRVKTNFDSPNSPIVGVYALCSGNETSGKPKCEDSDIRRFMSHVQDYYAQREIRQDIHERRVYLVTDEFTVLKRVVKKNPQYTFYGYYSGAKWKYSREKKHTTVVTTGLLVDLFMLPMCDHVVGSFSSHVGRMVYEIMQIKRIDASYRFTPLDQSVYHFIDEQHIRVAVLNNTGGSTINFNMGDLIDVTSNYRNGTGYGTVKKTKISGLIPLYKTEQTEPYSSAKSNEDLAEYTSATQEN